MNRLWLNGSLVVGMLGMVTLLGLADGLFAQAQKGGQKGGKGGGVAGGVQMAGGNVQKGFGKSVSDLAKQGLKGKDLANAIKETKGKGNSMGKGKGGGAGGAGKGGPGGKGPAGNNAGQQANVGQNNNVQAAAVVGARGGMNQKKGGGGAPAGKAKAKGP